VVLQVGRIFNNLNEIKYMRALVIGYSGTIGKAVTSLLQEKGYEVIMASRSTNPALNLEDPSSIDSFFNSSNEFDAIVCVAGDVAGGPIDKVSDEQVNLSLNSKLGGQINVVRKGLSKLNANGVIALTGGMLAFMSWPATSLYAMVNAGLDAFAKGAALDLTEGQRLVIVHPPYIAETAAKLGMDTSPWPNADEAAKAYLEAIEESKNGEAVFVKGYEPGK
jgi:NAD(P)-dependent dehydrogenase (short-subunit alcohol dehydrogenase family)